MTVELFQEACKTGNLADVKKYDCPEAREARDFCGFRWACDNGHLEVVNYLMTKMTTEEIAKVFQKTADK